MPFESKVIKDALRRRIHAEAPRRAVVQALHRGPQLAAHQRQPLDGNAQFIDQAGQTLIGLGCIADMRT